MRESFRVLSAVEFMKVSVSLLSSIAAVNSAWLV